MGWGDWSGMTNRRMLFTMTIAVAVKTSSAVIFAADSKTTTAGIVGFEQDGTPVMMHQTYDNAIKVAHDRSKSLMAMVAGSANIGQVPAPDLMSAKSFPVVPGESSDEQDGRLRGFVNDLAAEKRAYWETTQVPPDNWLGPTLLVAAPSAAGPTPRVWRIDLAGTKEEVTEILQAPGIRLEGTYNSAFTLLYGYEGEVLAGIATQMGLDVQAMFDALGKLSVLKPLDKLNLWTMPTQDAIDLAVFLAEVQEEMDRFLPGTPACGGPIDVMVLQMTPDPRIISFPGKVLHHPRRNHGGTE